MPGEGAGKAMDDEESEVVRDMGAGVAARVEWAWLGWVVAVGSGLIMWNSLFSIPSVRGWLAKSGP